MPASHRGSRGSARGFDRFAAPQRTASNAIDGGARQMSSHFLGTDLLTRNELMSLLVRRHDSAGPLDRCHEPSPRARRLHSHPDWRSCSCMILLATAFVRPGAVLAQSEVAGESGRPVDPAAPSLEPVTVTTNRFPDRFDYVGSTIVVRRAAIEALGAGSVADVLRALPGVQVASNASGGVEVRLRGLPPQSTRILIDGAAAGALRRDLQWHVDDIPTDAVERIEVVRSPSAEYEGTSGGTINIVLRSARRDRETLGWITDQRIRGRDALALQMSRTGPIGGSAGSATDASDPSGRAPGNWGYFVSLAGGPRHLASNTINAARSESPFSESETVDTYRMRSTPWTLVSRVSGTVTGSDRLTFRSIASTTRQEGTGTTAGYGPSAAGTDDFFSDTRIHSRRDVLPGAVDWSHGLASARIDSSLGFDRAATNHSLARLVSRDPAGAAGGDGASFREDRKDRSWQFRSKFVESAGSTVRTVGAEVAVASVASETTYESLAMSARRTTDAHVTTSALYGQIEWSSDLLLDASWVAGLRLQSNRIRAGAAESAGVVDDVYVQPSVNARAPFGTDAQLRANLAFVTRTPRLWELLDRSAPRVGTNSPNTPDFLGNPRLRPEHGLAADFGVERQLPRGGQAGAGIFVRHQKDVVARTLGIVRGRWTEHPENVGSAAIWGLEADYRADLRWLGLPPDWMFSGSLSVLDSRMLSGEKVGSRLVGQARYVSSLSVNRPMKLTGGGFGGATLSLVGRADLDQPGDRSIEVSGFDRSRAQLDVFVGGVATSWGFWRLNLYNVTDAPRDTRRSIVDGNGLSASNRTVLSFSPRVFLTIGTRF